MSGTANNTTSFYSNNFKSFNIFLGVRLLLVGFRLYFVCMFLVVVPTIFIISYGQENQTTNEQDYVGIIKDIGITIITLLGGGLSAKYIVSSWQTRKEISDIRNEILINYTNSFKNFVALLDTFVAKLVMEFAQLTDHKPNDKPALSELLPWGFTFNDLIYYSRKFPIDSNLTDNKNESYQKEFLVQKFKELEAVNKETYVSFQVEKLDVFRHNNETNFKTDFYQTRNKLFEFKANLSQYYELEDSAKLSDQFSAMWEYMMGCYVLVNKILITGNEHEFIGLLKKYNTLAEFQFDMMIDFERKLISKKIHI